MADADEKAKAEKLAAARKRVEQLKKQKGKKGTASKKKEEKAETENDASAAQDKAEDPAAEEAEAGDPAEEATDTTTKPTHERKTSVSTKVKSSGDTPLFPAAGETASDIYKKQAQRIDELEKENKRLTSESQENEKRLRKTEEQLEELRETSGEIAELKTKASQAEDSAGQVEKLKAELEGLKRQNAQLQSQATRVRRQSTSSPSNPDDLQAQLASKANTIESLELEISNLNNQIGQINISNTEQTNRITSLESDLSKAEDSASSTAKELSDLKANLQNASDRANKEGSSRSSAETRIAQLEAELAAAQRAADNAAKRAETLEKKVETLTTLHRESDARQQVKIREGEKAERDAKELRSRVTFLSNENSKLREAGDQHRKANVQGSDDGGVEELVDEERRQLQGKIRELEEEVYELRQGLWRDKRREMQPGLDDGHHHDPGFDEVELSSAHASRRPAGQKGSSFQDVINSGISAFMGGDGPRRSSIHHLQQQQQRSRGESVGLMSDDGFAFDEDAFRQAQEEEGKRRLERVREIKRGLKDWEGWRVDIVEVREGMGGVFDV